MSKNLNDNLNIFMEYNIYAPKRTIYLGSHQYLDNNEESGTDFLMVEQLIKSITYLNTISNKPIIIHLNNLGGDYYHGISIYDCIRASKSHVYIIAWGHCMSMGSIIFQAADSRIISPNCTMMIHDGTDELTGHTQNVERWATYSKQLRKKMYKIYYDRIKVKKTRTTMKKIEELCRFDSIMDAQKAVDFGLADWVLDTLEDPNEFCATDIKADQKYHAGEKTNKLILEEDEEWE